MMHIVVQVVMVLVVASAVDANSLHQMRSMVRQAQLKVKAGCPTTQSMSTNYVEYAAYLKCIEKAKNKQRTSCGTNEECSKRCLNLKTVLKDAHSDTECATMKCTWTVDGIKGKTKQCCIPSRQNCD